MKKTYHISFDTKELPGAIKAVTVTLDNVIVTDMNASMNIDLCNHPLYSILVAYVQANPVRNPR